MLRPRKKFTVRDLQQLKGRRCLAHIHVKSPEQAAEAEAAGVDLMSCSFDLQRERIAAFGEYIAEVKEWRFPERSHLVEMDPGLLGEFMRSPVGTHPDSP